jgi:hypothetical protein
MKLRPLAEFSGMSLSTVYTVSKQRVRRLRPGSNMRERDGVAVQDRFQQRITGRISDCGQ